MDQLHLIENTCDQKRIYANPSSYPNPKARLCFRTVEMTSFFDPVYRYHELGVNWKLKVSVKLYLVVVLPDPFREMGRGGTPRRPNSLAMPQDLDQGSKMEEVVPKDGAPERLRCLATSTWWLVVRSPFLLRKVGRNGETTFPGCLTIRSAPFVWKYIPFCSLSVFRVQFENEWSVIHSYIKILKHAHSVQAGQ